MQSFPLTSLRFFFSLLFLFFFLLVIFPHALLPFPDLSLSLCQSVCISPSLSLSDASSLRFKKKKKEKKREVEKSLPSDQGDNSVQITSLAGFLRPLTSPSQLRPTPIHLRDSSDSLVSLDHRLLGLVVKASASRAADLGSIPAFGADLFPGRVTPVT